MTKYRQLVKEQRTVINSMINHKETFTSIGKAIGVDRTSVSKEIRRNRYIKSNFYSPYDFNGIKKAESNCPLLKKPPYVCNRCFNKTKCFKHKLYYNDRIAQNHYEEKLVDARTGIDITPEEVETIENTIVPLIKDKHQSINQIYSNHPDILYFAKSTFYRYVELGVFSLTNLDLPKKVKYKKRKRKNNDNRRELAILKGRRYEDFCKFIYEHTKMHIFEMDTVIGRKSDKKVLLTLYFRDTHFMLIRLLEKKTTACTSAEFELLKEQLGIKLYARIFRIGLTDNGTEFFNPYSIEKDYLTDKKIANLFYCDPNRPDQKGAIEKNHVELRKLLPKHNSFKHLTQDDVHYVENMVNNTPRDSLNGQTPYNLTLQKYPEFISKLSYCKYISPDDVDLTSLCDKKVSHNE